MSDGILRRFCLPPTSTTSNGQKEVQSGSGEWVSRFVVQKMGHTDTRDTTLPIEIFRNPAVLSNVGVWALKCLTRKKRPTILRVLPYKLHLDSIPLFMLHFPSNLIWTQTITRASPFLPSLPGYTLTLHVHLPINFLMI